MLDGGLEGITVAMSPIRGLVGSSAEETGGAVAARRLRRLIDGAKSPRNSFDFFLAELQKWSMEDGWEGV